MNTDTTPRLNLADAVEDLAPPPPPCFANRFIWREYLKSAAAVQYQRGEQRVILLVDGEPRFNTEMNFCRDCMRGTALAMKAAGRCNPDHLKKEATTK